MNVCYRHSDPQNLAGWVRTHHDMLDVVYLQEVEPPLKKHLETLKDIFPYQILEKDSLWFGRAILSKVPIKGQVKLFPERPIHLFNVRAYYLDLMLSTPKGNVNLFGIHASSPSSGQAWLLRNLELEHMGKIVSKATSAYKILVGDFNTTPYSQAYQQLLKKGGLKPSVRYPHFTFPSCFSLDFLRISIDHCLISPNIEVLHAETLQNLGSDYLHVLTTLLLK